MAHAPDAGAAHAGAPAEGAAPVSRPTVARRRERLDSADSAASGPGGLRLFRRGTSSFHLKPPAELTAEARAFLQRGAARVTQATLTGVRTTLTTIKESHAYQVVSRPLEHVGEVATAQTGRLVLATQAELSRIEARLEARLRERFGGYDTTHSAAAQAKRTLERRKEIFRLLDKAGKCVEREASCAHCGSDAAPARDPAARTRATPAAGAPSPSTSWRTSLARARCTRRAPRSANSRTTRTRTATARSTSPSFAPCWSD